MSDVQTIIYRTPETPEEFELYYALRAEVLRSPWGVARNDDEDGNEATAVHGMAITAEGRVVGVARLHLRDKEEGQIRYMAVHPDFRGQNIGRDLLTYLEHRAHSQGIRLLTLNARQPAVPFYLSCGYLIVAEGELLWGKIPHKVMQKKLV